MEIARKNPDNFDNIKSGDKHQQTVIIASKTDRFGNEIPISKSDFDTNKAEKGRSKKTTNKYSKDGKLEKYFDDDNKYSLKDLVEREKQITADDNNLMYSTMKSKTLKSTNEDFDDDFIGKCASKQLDGWSRIKVLGGISAFFVFLCQN